MSSVGAPFCFLHPGFSFFKSRLMGQFLESMPHAHIVRVSIDRLFWSHWFGIQANLQYLIILWRFLLPETLISLSKSLVSVPASQPFSKTQTTSDPNVHILDIALYLYWGGPWKHGPCQFAKRCHGQTLCCSGLHYQGAGIPYCLVLLITNDSLCWPSRIGEYSH